MAVPAAHPGRHDGTVPPTPPGEHPSHPDLLAICDTGLEAATSLLQSAARTLAASSLDEDQAFAYDLAHASASVAAAEALVSRAHEEPAVTPFALVAAAEAAQGLVSATLGREETWGLEVAEPGGPALDDIRMLLRAGRSPARIAELAGGPPGRGLGEELDLVADTFRRFAEERIRPVADQIHRTNADIPEEILAGLAELGAFGLSIPEAYGGFAAQDEDTVLAMLVATEELSRVSLGAGGSLVTRPEIVARALLAGGTEAQRRAWLPRLASGDVMAAVAVTEPDFGSDVASLGTLATREAGGWSLSGTKTWCTFAARANVLALLARTDPDRSLAHRGLSLFLVEKPVTPSAGFLLHQSAEPGGPPGGGRLEGRPIDTLGYRGMHSYELAFDRWWVPGEAVVGGEAGAGRGFYLQMAGFENGRLQTAARAVGVMQAAFEAAQSYAAGRRVFGRPLADYQLTRVKLGRMAATVAATRALAYRAAALLASGGGTTEASMVKAYGCKAAEWVAREAMQLHGGMGYAEEFPVSRYFVDARVLSIFEGADETLALKVIARQLVAAAGR